MSSQTDHKQIDWRACCIVLANSHLQFVEFVMKACPNNAAIQELGETLKDNLSFVISQGAIEVAKDK